MPHDLHHVFHPAATGGPTLLLVHPLGADLHFWGPFVDLLRGQIACLAYDLRSAGSSPRSDGPVTIDQHVADLESLRAGLGLERVIPVGCAIGSMTAAAYAAAYPDECLALVLSNPTAKTLAAPRAMLAARANQVLADGMQSILPGAVDKAFLGQPQDDEYRRYYDRFARQDPRAYANSILGVRDADVADALGQLRCPTLVIGGVLDVLLPLEHAQGVHELVASCEFARVERAAHFTPLQRPAEFSALVLDFLQRHKLLAEI